MLISPLILFVLCLNNHVNSELYTSIGHLTTLVESIDGVTRALEKFIYEETLVYEKARKMLLDYRTISEASTKNAEHFISNPVNAFLLIKKLTIDFQEFVNLLNNQDRLKILVDQVKDAYLLPSNEDYTGAALALHRLEDTYQLNTNDISLGKLSEKYPSRPLTAFECFELGRIAYEKRDNYHTLRWMTQALKQIETEGENDNIYKITILEYLSFTTHQQGNFLHAVDLTKEILRLNPNHPRAKNNIVYYQEDLKQQLKNKLGDTGQNSLNSDPLVFKNLRPPAHYPERDLYENLCRYESNDIPPSRLKNLKCRYINYDPFLVIAPVKEEQLFDKPAIYLYHDVITDEQVRVMKELAKPKLKRAIVRSPITGEYEPADYRISKSGWLRDSEHPHLSYLSKLVNSVTNLSLTTAEEWQIANYGLGGQYEPHFDFARKTDPGNAFDPSIGNRVATWLFYLEAPERGGATVFPSINLTVLPKRRSAAFWHNLHTSGDGDYQTRHAACPVLFGTKWVSNKWIHVVGQEFTRPCQLKREYSEEMDF